MAAPAANTDRLAELARTVERGFEKLNEKVDGLDSRLRLLEQTQGQKCAVEELKVAGIVKDVQDNTDAIKALTARLDTIEPWVRGFRWLAGALGALILALIWGILTHQVAITFQ